MIEPKKEKENSEKLVVSTNSLLTSVATVCAVKMRIAVISRKDCLIEKPIGARPLSTRKPCCFGDWLAKTQHLLPVFSALLILLLVHAFTKTVPSCTYHWLVVANRTSDYRIHAGAEPVHAMLSLAHCSPGVAVRRSHIARGQEREEIHHIYLDPYYRAKPDKSILDEENASYVSGI